MTTPSTALGMPLAILRQLAVLFSFTNHNHNNNPPFNGRFRDAANVGRLLSELSTLVLVYHGTTWNYCQGYRVAIEPNLQRTKTGHARTHTQHAK